MFVAFSLVGCLEGDEGRKLDLASLSEIHGAGALPVALKILLLGIVDLGRSNSHHHEEGKSLQLKTPRNHFARRFLDRAFHCAPLFWNLHYEASYHLSGTGLIVTPVITINEDLMIKNKISVQFSSVQMPHMGETYRECLWGANGVLLFVCLFGGSFVVGLGTD